MKTNLLFALLVIFTLSGCDRKTAAIQNEIRVIEKTATDTTQTHIVRESAGILKDVLREKKEVEKLKMKMAQWELLYSRNQTTIATYVSFLKAIEKKLPEKLPPVEVYEAMKNKAGSAKIVEYNVGQTVIMMSNSIQNITLYNDPAADAEVEGVLKRLKKKYSPSETAEKIMALLNTVHGYGIEEREMGIKPWESPRKPTGSID